MSEIVMDDVFAQQQKTPKIPVKCKDRNKAIPVFLWSVLFLAIVSLLYLDINWSKILSRIPDIGTVFWNLGHYDFSKIDLILTSLLDTICIAVLSLLYSMVLGIFFGMFAARNVFKINALSVFVQSFFSFLRAVPTPIWVILILGCLGMGPEIPEETLEALEATGTTRVNVFFNAVLPAALSQIVAWCGMRLEVNFSECTILGMVGAGGVGFVISTSLQGYDYGTAGVAITLVFIVAYCIERMFVRIKKKFN